VILAISQPAVKCMLLIADENDIHPRGVFQFIYIYYYSVFGFAFEESANVTRVFDSKLYNIIHVQCAYVIIFASTFRRCMYINYKSIFIV